MRPAYPAAVAGGIPVGYLTPYDSLAFNPHKSIKQDNVPAPQVHTRLLQRHLCLPPELLIRPLRHRCQIQHIALSPLRRLILEVPPNSC